MAPEPRRVYRRPGGPVPGVPSHEEIAAALLRSPVTLTRGEAAEIADTLRHVLFPTTREAR